MSEAGDTPTLTGAVPTTIVVGTALAVGAAVVAALSGITIDQPISFLILTVLGAVSESRSSHVQRLSSFSLTSTIIGIAVVLCGPLGAALVGLVSAACNISWQSTVVRIFNATMSGSVGLVGGATFTLTSGGGLEGPLFSHHVRDLLIPFAIASLAMFATNAILLAAIIRATAGVPPLRSLRDFTRHSAPLYSIGALIAYLTIVLWLGADLGYFTVLVMAPPLLLAQRTYASIAAEASIEDEIVEALVAAITLNRPGATAHSALVRIIAQEIGNVAGLSEGRARAVDRAAALHHLGLVTHGRSGPLPMSPSTAARGARVIEQVGFLAPARELIAAQSGAAPVSDPTALGVLTAADALAADLERLAAHHHLTEGDLQAAVRRVEANDRLDPAARTALGHAAGSLWARWLLAWTNDHGLSCRHREVSS